MNLDKAIAVYLMDNQINEEEFERTLKLEMLENEDIKDEESFLKYHGYNIDKFDRDVVNIHNSLSYLVYDDRELDDQIQLKAEEYVENIISDIPKEYQKCFDYKEAISKFVDEYEPIDLFSPRYRDEFEIAYYKTTYFIYRV